MNKQGIIDKTKAIMNEIGKEESLTLLSEDTVKLSSYIESVIPDAINIIAGRSETSPFLVNTGSVTSGGSSNMSDGCTIVPIPDDFLRFIALRLSGWKREVQMVEPYGGVEYKIQHNSITRSGIEKPSCVFAYNGGSKCIECFPVGTLSYFVYVKSMSNIPSSGELDGYSDTLLSAVCYACAYLVYSIFEMHETAGRMLEIAFQVIPKS